MNRLKYLLVGLLISVPVLAGVAVAHAQSFRSGPNVTVAASQTVNNTLFAAGSTVEVEGTVNGDVFCAGQNIVITGTVNGDVLCAGQNVSVSGKVSGDVRLAGQNVTIGGQVAGNASVGSQSLVLLSGATVGGDLSAGTVTAVLNGSVGRDVAVGTGDGSLTINNKVGRNVQASVDRLTLGSGAVVGGSITYVSANTLTKSGSAQVAGTITQTQPPASSGVQVGSIVALAWLFVLYMFIALLIVALVLVLALPRMFHNATSYSLEHMGKTILVGLVASLVVPAVLFVLLFTVIGIPLALFAGLVWLVVVLLAWPFAAYLLGRLLWRHGTNAIWIMLLGAVLLLLVYLIPFVGALVGIVAFWFGLGTILLYAREHTGRPHYHMAPVMAESESEPVHAATTPEVKPPKQRPPRL